MKNDELISSLLDSDVETASTDWLFREAVRLFIERSKTGVVSKVVHGSERAPRSHLLGKLMRVLVLGLQSDTNPTSSKIDAPLLNAAITLLEDPANGLFTSRHALDPQLRRERSNLRAVVQEKKSALLKDPNLADVSFSHSPEVEGLVPLSPSWRPPVVFSPGKKSLAALLVINRLLTGGVPVASVLVPRRSDLAGRVRPGFLSRSRAWKRQLRLAGERVGRILRPDKRFPDLREALAQDGITEKSLSDFLEKKGIPLKEVGSVNSKESLDHLSGSGAEYMIYMGQGIVRSEVIDGLGLGVLHSHPAPIPRYAGMDCIEWAVLMGDMDGIGPTTQLLSIELDRGPVISHEQLGTPFPDRLSVLRSYVLVRSLTNLARDAIHLVEEGEQATRLTDRHRRQYFVMTPVLRRIAADRLRGFSLSQ